jgi:hypothetical protein
MGGGNWQVRTPSPGAANWQVRAPSPGTWGQEPRLTRVRTKLAIACTMLDRHAQDPTGIEMKVLISLEGLDAQCF